LCLHGGSYDEADRIVALGTNSGKTISGYPGERAVVNASFMGDISRNMTLEGFKIDSQTASLNSNSDSLQSVNAEDSSGLTVRHMHLSNKGTALGHREGGSCFFGATSDHVTIEYSLIKPCGEHGIYAAGSDTVNETVRHTWIEDTEGAAFKFTHTGRNIDYLGVVANRIPESQSVAPYETPGRGYEAMIWNDQTNDTEVRNSVAFSADERVFVAGANYTGGNNRVLDSCTGGIAPELRNLDPSDAWTGNVYVNDPQFSGFKVTDPWCAAKLPADSPFRPASP
jgi:hypothetical protein